MTFGDATSASTTATFTEAGQYVLRLTANDGAKTAFDEMTVTVTDPCSSVPATSRPIACRPLSDSLANAEATATLLDGIPGTVFTLGDNAYQDGTAAEFANCYDPTWGARTSNGRGRSRAITTTTRRTRPATSTTSTASACQTALPAIERRRLLQLRRRQLARRRAQQRVHAAWNPNGCGAGSAQEHGYATISPTAPRTTSSRCGTGRATARAATTRTHAYCSRCGRRFTTTAPISTLAATGTTTSGWRR